MPPGELAFSGAEMRRRRAAFAAEMARGEVSWALVHGANRTGSAVSWLTGWPVTREAMLVAAPDAADDVLLVSFFNHVPQARRLSAARVEWAGSSAVATALDLIAARGGMHHIHYLGVTAMDDPALAVPAQWPTGRPIRHRDVVTCEISAAAAPDYAGQLLRTFTIGAPPTALYADLHAVAAATYDAVARRLRPGARARDLAAAAAGVIDQTGFTGIDDLAHGFGGGYLPPVVPAPGRPLPVPDFTLAAGMTVVVQPNVVTRDGRAGVQTGELLLVTDSGPQRLHAFPQGLQEAG